MMALNIRKCYETPRCQESTGTSQAGRSPLTEELLAPGEHVTTVLDDQYEDPEIEQAVANIPLTHRSGGCRDGRCNLGF